MAVLAWPKPYRPTNGVERDACRTGVRERRSTYWVTKFTGNSELNLPTVKI